MTEIHLIERVFRDNERKKLLEDSKPLLLSLKDRGGATYPGKQTLPNLQMNPKFEFPLNHLMEVINKKTRLNLSRIGRKDRMLLQTVTIFLLCDNEKCRSL